MTGVANNNETNQTIIIIFLQLDIVHNERERIGNTITTNLSVEEKGYRFSFYLIKGFLAFIKKVDILNAFLKSKKELKIKIFKFHFTKYLINPLLQIDFKLSKTLKIQLKIQWQRKVGIRNS
jgi:hypothetical protein